MPKESKHSPTPRTDAATFELRWRGGNYFVSIHNLDTCEVVQAKVAIQLETENAALLAALEAVVAALSQPVQFTDSQDASNILRGDCKFAREAAQRAIAKAKEQP